MYSDSRISIGRIKGIGVLKFEGNIWENEVFGKEGYYDFLLADWDSENKEWVFIETGGLKSFRKKLFVSYCKGNHLTYRV